MSPMSSLLLYQKKEQREKITQRKRRKESLLTSLANIKKRRKKKREYQINFLLLTVAKIPRGKDFNAIPRREKKSLSQQLGITIFLRFL